MNRLAGILASLFVDVVIGAAIAQRKPVTRLGPIRDGGALASPESSPMFRSCAAARPKRKRLQHLRPARMIRRRSVHLPPRLAARIQAIYRDYAGLLAANHPAKSVIRAEGWLTPSASVNTTYRLGPWNDRINERGSVILVEHYASDLGQTGRCNFV